MAKTTTLGDLRLKIGEYEDGAQTKNRSETMGKLMLTIDDDGNRRFWGTVKMHHLQPSLLALARPFIKKKGDTELIFNVYLDDRQAGGQGQNAGGGGGASAPPKQAPPAGMSEDEIPF